MSEKKKLIYKIGLSLIIVSLTLWLTPVIIPFTPLSAKTKTGIISVALVISEICFWIGVLIVGKQAAKKIRGYMNPKNWKKSHTEEKKADTDQL